MVSSVLRRPWWIAAVSLVVWLICTLLFVTFDGNGNGEQWLRAIATTLGSGFAVGFLGGGLVGWWEVRERRWAPRRPMLGLLHKAAEELDALGTMMGRARFQLMLVAGTGPLILDPFPEGLFNLPVSEVRAQLLDDEISAFLSATMEVMTLEVKDWDPGEETPKLTEGQWSDLEQLAGDGRRSIDRLLSIVERLRDYVDDMADSETAGSGDLKARMTALLHTTPLLDGPRKRDKMALFEWNKVLEAAQELGVELSAIYSHLEQTTDDPWLRRSFTADATHNERLDARLQEPLPFGLSL